jgi:hypothetical protein
MVGALGVAVGGGRRGLEAAPRMLRTVIERDAWRSFVSADGQEVTHRTFRAFAAASPPRGLGASIEFLSRLCGEDEQLCTLLRAVSTPRKGRPPAEERATEEEMTGENGKNIPTSSGRPARGDRVSFVLKRLAETDQELYMRTTLPKQDREYLSPWAAAVKAGLRKPKSSLRTDDPGAVVTFVRRHFTPEQRRRIAALLLEQDEEDADEKESA